MSPVARSRPAALAFAVPALGSALVMASASAPSPFYPALQAGIGFSPVALTGIFAIYTITLLATLLVTGSVSDHLGRRPVLSAGFALLAVFAVLFAQADTVAGLVAARALQGVACGLLISALSAAMLDLEPPAAPGLAAICNAILPLAGLALGALLAGAAIDLWGPARAGVFDGLAMVSALFAVGVWALPETAPRHAGLARALQPRVRVPEAARQAFWRTAPALFSSWATGGLYLSLGASIAAHVFGLSRGIEQGAVVTLLAGMGALACFLARHRPAPATLRLGTRVLAAGTALTLAGLGLGSVGLYLAALAVAGAGFGATFYGGLRTIAPLAPPQERGELFAAVYTICYLAFGVPVVIAGMMVPLLGLIGATWAYGTVILCTALAASVLNRR
ncbi:MFS transporter [Frigidibacter sp. MR17.24]|uniref:MFS transporter n=1 Tax=Frigidibacter sp. MR17.24 TaxID=3127345 RepID=UPI003012E542